MEESALVVEEIESQFEANPALSLQRLRALKTADFPSFVKTGSTLLQSGKDSRLARLILHLICENDATLDNILFGNNGLDASTAGSIAILAAKVDPRLQPLWLSELKGEIENGDLEAKADRVIRRLEVLALCAEPIRLAPTLSLLCHHDDARIRSKAVLLSTQLSVGTRIPSAIGDSNERVRANAIEAIWGRRDKQALEVFQSGISSTNHRIAGNSLLGLHLAGQLSPIRGIYNMAEDEDPPRSSAGIWVMGQSKDPRFLGYLQQRLRNTTDSRRMSILKAARLIKQNKDQILALPRLNIELTRFDNGGLGRTEFSFLTINSQGRAVSTDELQPNHFVVHDGARRVDQFRVEIKGSAQPVHILFLLPMPEFRTSPFPELLEQAMEAAITSKRPLDHWAIERYASSDGSSLKYAPLIEFATSSNTLKSDHLPISIRARNKFELSIDELIPLFPANAGQKHLVIVASPAWDASFEVPERWAERCRRYGITPHLLAASILEDKAFDSWKSFCLGLGGSMNEFDWEKDLDSTFRHFNLGLQSRFEITCHFVNIAANQKTAEPIKVEVFSEIGYAQIRLDPSGKVLESEA